MSGSQPSVSHCLGISVFKAHNEPCIASGTGCRDERCEGVCEASQRHWAEACECDQLNTLNQLLMDRMRS